MKVTAGLIANPASGKDIRRLVAHASVFGNDEKINIVRRVMLGLAAAGVERVLYMPDPYRLVQRALEEADPDLDTAPVEGSFHSSARDTENAAAAMQAAGAAVIVSLGGDGTNRALARGTCDVPLVPISTGTNNVFPVMVEGTVAGLAAGAVATGAVDPEAVAPRCKLVEIDLGSGARDLALIDAVVMAPGFVASRAIWETDGLREVVLTRAQADAVGMSAVGGMVAPVEPSDDFGLHLVLGEGAGDVRAAIAPGLIRAVPLAKVERLGFGDAVAIEGPGLLALDGEREVVLPAGQRASMTITRSGPPVVDIPRALAAARDAGFMRG